MSVGTGIFLAGTLLALVAVYITTRDRWNWSKIILWPSGILLAVAASLYVYSLIPERPKIQKSFWDIPLDASESDVLFIKGNPTRKQGDDWLYAFLDNENRNWKYIYRVYFKAGKVWSVSYFSADSVDWREEIQGIRVGYGENSVREKFGAPSPSVASDDGLRRIYHYRDYNLIFELAQNKVTSLGIYNPEAAPKGVAFRDQ
jgi:hypothetical protein